MIRITHIGHYMPYANQLHAVFIQQTGRGPRETDEKSVKNHDIHKDAKIKNGYSGISPFEPSCTAIIVQFKNM